MLGQKFCPYCGNNVSSKTFNLISCDCGWFDRGSEKKARIQSDKKAMTILTMVAAFIFLGVVHVSTWGGYAFSVPFLRAQQVTGLLSANGYGSLAEACMSIGDASCAENAFTQMYRKSKDPAALFKLANLQVLLKRPNDAAKTFDQYFKQGGESGEAMVAYGKVLEQLNRNREAVKYYDASIAARTEVLPVNAMSGIVRIHIKEGRYNEAYTRIVGFHASAGNAKGYLNTELEQVRRIVRSRAKRSVASNPQG